MRIAPQVRTYAIEYMFVTAPEPVTTAFTYNDANELTSMVENGVVTTNFSYDDWGRTTGKTQGAYEATYDWRYGDKLKYVESDFPGEAASVSYIYDGLGKRRVKHVNGTDWTHYRWDRGWNMIAEYDHGVSEWDIGNLSNTFIPGLAEVHGTTPATGNYRYYETDHLGTVKGIRDQNQSVLAGYDYSPYGEPYYQAGLALNKAFTGHIWEPEIGQYYAPYRYYAPDLGRWLSRDPLEVVEGPNDYAYASERPTSVLDFLGLWGDETHGPYNGEDHGWRSPYFPWSTWRHFRHVWNVEQDLQRAMVGCDFEDFLSYMHQGQDYFSHYGPGYRWWIGGHMWWGHLPDDVSLNYGAYLEMRQWTRRMEKEWFNKCMRCGGHANNG